MAMMEPARVIKSWMTAGSTLSCTMPAAHCGWVGLEAEEILLVERHGVY